MLIFICLLGYWQSVTSFRQYQDLIPNGQNVPHSCLDNFLWHGIGHQSFKGGGPLNRFGIDFIKFKKVWKKICPLDSDGDGMTNGQELGDPDCKWTRNQMPVRTIKITNPGNQIY
ncbi:hypothetical protein KUTeg_016912 [Tegillarca granosa]|uniref:Temptin Cys/Cys disulfide domain-containing protein n=1 Tax=Tegillarca granosa TaxID=220873 RepID=A0ABQ9EM83_TEGGR|nr:hypothetical protein KUTeg_016912 [Tegillarca granosa]